MGELYEKRKQAYIDATSFIEPKKIPVGIEVTMWPFAYAGVTYNEVKDNPENAAKCYTKFLDDMSIDYFMLGNGVFTDPEARQLMGNDDYRFAPDGVCIQHNQAGISFMKDDEYDQLINDYDHFRGDVLVRRAFDIYQWPEEKAYENIKKAARLNWNNVCINRLIDEDVARREILMNLDYGVPAGLTPFNHLFDLIRGMKDTFIDLRRRPDEVRAAVKVIAEHMRLPYNLEDYRGHQFPLGCMVYHSEPFLSAKQFDEFFFKDFKEFYGPLMDVGVKYIIKGEGHFMQTLDRFRELPKGSCMFMLDQDDPFEVYEKIGDWCSLATGISVEMLKFDTKQNCLDYAKRCFDTFAPGGGFLFCTNKPLIAANDTNIDNLLAVYEFANEYGTKK